MQYIVKLSGYYGSSEFYVADTLFNVLFYIDIDIVLGYNIIRLIVSIIKSILYCDKRKIIQNNCKKNGKGKLIITNK